MTAFQTVTGQAGICIFFNSVLIISVLNLVYLIDFTHNTLNSDTNQRWMTTTWALENLKRLMLSFRARALWCSCQLPYSGPQSLGTGRLGWWQVWLPMPAVTPWCQVAATPGRGWQRWRQIGRSPGQTGRTGQPRLTRLPTQCPVAVTFDWTMSRCLTGGTDALGQKICCHLC